MANQSVGRVFCITGQQTTQKSLDQTVPIIKTAPRSTSALGWIGCSDTDSSTSGYLSSSSFESSGEEKRLVPNVQKVVRVWDSWREQVPISTGPINHTPKQGSEHVKPGQNIYSKMDKCILAIKKDLTQKQRVDKTVIDDSFWDITTTRVQKSSSESNFRKLGKSSKSGSKPRKTVKFADERDAGLEIKPSQESRNPSKNQDWKRRSFLAQSTSQEDFRITSTGGNSNYTPLPKYRVKVNADTKLVSKISRSVADFSDEGKPVDESMTEFLSNVDKENLASFLEFYDKVTDQTNYERARRSPKNYEAVYY